MRTDAELTALAARMLNSQGTGGIATMLREARPPLLLTLPIPRHVPWKFAAPPPSSLTRLLERGELVWAIRLEGEPRPYEESGSDEFTVGFRHPQSGAIELRRFRTSWIPATLGMTLVFPLVLDVETGDALPWSFFGLNERDSEVAAGLAAPPPSPPAPQPDERSQPRQIRERVSGTVHSLAFVDHGRALVCAHRDALAKRAWPSLDLLEVKPLATSLATATQNGTLLCVSDAHVLELDANLAEQRRVVTAAPGDGGVMALGMDDLGAVVICRRLGTGARYRLERHEGDHDAPVATLATVALEGRGWPSWAALLPNSKRVVFAMDSGAPEQLDWSTGAHARDWHWPPGWQDRLPGLGRDGRRSWLSVDAAVDERCLMVSDAGAQTTVVWLNDDGDVDRFVAFEKTSKGPSRGGAATVHPTDDVALCIDISGRLFVSDARTGKLLEVVDDLFSGGYRGRKSEDPTG